MLWNHGFISHSMKHHVPSAGQGHIVQEFGWYAQFAHGTHVETRTFIASAGLYEIPTEKRIAIIRDSLRNVFFIVMYFL